MREWRVVGEAAFISFTGWLIHTHAQQGLCGLPHQYVVAQYRHFQMKSLAFFMRHQLACAHPHAQVITGAQTLVLVDTAWPTSALDALVKFGERRE